MLNALTQFIVSRMISPHLYYYAEFVSRVNFKGLVFSLIIMQVARGVSVDDDRQAENVLTLRCAPDRQASGAFGRLEIIMTQDQTICDSDNIVLGGQATCDSRNHKSSTAVDESSIIDISLTKC